MRITIAAAVALAVLTIAAPAFAFTCDDPIASMSPSQIRYCDEQDAYRAAHPSEVMQQLRRDEEAGTGPFTKCVSGAHYDSASRGCVLDTYKPEQKPSEGSSPVSALFGLALLAGLFILMRGGVRNWRRGSPAPAGKPAAGRTASEE